MLPDIAQASVPWRFGLAYEEQTQQPVLTGRILLQTWDVDPATATLTMRNSHAFGGVGAAAFRRRPILSVYPSAFPGLDVFAIAFNQLSAAGEGNVIYEEWDLTDGAHRLLWVIGWGWDQAGDDRKPVPLLGRELSFQVWFGRCYAERSLGGVACQLLNYVRKDANYEDELRPPLDVADELQRPEASYQFDGVHDNVALTWERLTDWNGTANPPVVRVWPRME